MLSVFLVHAPSDAPFALELSSFLEGGCDDIRIVPDTVIRPGDDLISTAETGLSANVVVLLLSPASNPVRWARERWEPVLSGHDPESARIATVLIDECTFPLLLRRSLSFFDATRERLAAMRQLKRWLWGLHFGTSPNMAIASDLEILYASLADKPGTFSASGNIAERFARQAGRDFAAVVWIPAHGRTLTQVAGELGAQLGMLLDGELEDNCRRIREVLSRRRCLVILDSRQIAIDAVLPSGRTSILYTDEPVRIAEDDRSFAAARRLVVARRFAEAYELLYELFNAGIETESCARELVWICEHWDRAGEANSLRFLCGPAPAEQLRLF